MRHKLRLTLQWLGTGYCGWQAQPGSDSLSVSEVVHEALVAVTSGQSGGPVAAGRTDKGVHAMSQSVTVTIRGPPVPEDRDEAARARELDEMRDQLNAQLPTDVRVLRVEDAAGSANARWEATEKTYAYFVLCASAEALPELDAWRVGAWLRAGIRTSWTA